MVRGSESSSKSIMEGNSSCLCPSEVGLWGVTITGAAVRPSLSWEGQPWVCYLNHRQLAPGEYYQFFRKPFAKTPVPGYPSDTDLGTAVRDFGSVGN